MLQQTDPKLSFPLGTVYLCKLSPLRRRPSPKTLSITCRSHYIHHWVNTRSMVIEDIHVGLPVNFLLVAQKNIVKREVPQIIIILSLTSGTMYSFNISKGIKGLRFPDRLTKQFSIQNLRILSDHIPRSWAVRRNLHEKARFWNSRCQCPAARPWKMISPNMRIVAMSTLCDSDGHD